MDNEAVAPVAELTGIFKKYPYPRSLMLALDIATAQAVQGNDNDKFALGRLMTDFMDSFGKQTNVLLGPEDHVRAKKLLLEFFESLAERGHVLAMRFAAYGYANDDSSLSAAPDFAKACTWARKAEAAGDWVAARLLPDLERRLAESAANPPPRQMKIRK